MKVTIVPIVIGALGTVTKGLLKGLEELESGRRVETLQHYKKKKKKKKKTGHDWAGKVIHREMSK